MSTEKTQKTLNLAFCLLILLISCSKSQISDSKSPLIPGLKALNLDRYIGIQYTNHSPNPNYPDWEIFYYDTTDCKCIYGGDYFVASSRNDNSNDVLFYLAGGGACWPGQTLCAKSADPDEALEATRIIPLSGWNYIYVPYCDGSVHMGDSEEDSDNNGEIDRWYWGLRSTSAAVALMKELHPEPDKILITGNSAGGIGTIIASMVIRLQYPQTSLYVFNKVGPGLLNPKDKKTSRLIKKTWNLNQLYPIDCDNCKDQMIYLYDWMLDRDDKLKIGLVSSYQDLVSSAIFKMDPENYEDLLITTTDAIRNKHPGTFKRFFIKGNKHNISNSYQVNGISVRKWLEALISDSNVWMDILE